MNNKSRLVYKHVIILNSNLGYNLCQVNSALQFAANKGFSRLFSTVNGDVLVLLKFHNKEPCVEAVFLSQAAFTAFTVIFFKEPSNLIYKLIY